MSVKRWLLYSYIKSLFGLKLGSDHKHLDIKMNDMSVLLKRSHHHRSIPPKVTCYMSENHMNQIKNHILLKTGTVIFTTPPAVDICDITNRLDTRLVFFVKHL